MSIKNIIIYIINEFTVDVEKHTIYNLNGKKNTRLTFSCYFIFIKNRFFILFIEDFFVIQCDV